MAVTMAWPGPVPSAGETPSQFAPSLGRPLAARSRRRDVEHGLGAARPHAYGGAGNEGLGSRTDGIRAPGRGGEPTGDRHHMDPRLGSVSVPFGDEDPAGLGVVRRAAHLGRRESGQRPGRIRSHVPFLFLAVLHGDQIAGVVGPDEGLVPVPCCSRRFRGSWGRPRPCSRDVRNPACRRTGRCGCRPETRRRSRGWRS